MMIYQLSFEFLIRSYPAPLPLTLFPVMNVQQNLNQDILLDKLGLPTEGPQTDKRDRVSRYDTGVEGEEVEMEREVDVMIDISGQAMLSTMKYMAGLTGLTVSERSNNIVSSHQ